MPLLGAMLARACTAPTVGPTPTTVAFCTRRLCAGSLCACRLRFGSLCALGLCVSCLSALGLCVNGLCTLGLCVGVVAGGSGGSLGCHGARRRSTVFDTGILVRWRLISGGSCACCLA